MSTNSNTNTPYEYHNEQLPEQLNSLLEEYFYERKAKNGTNKKNAFFGGFDILSPEEKRSYRDYVYQLIRGEIPTHHPLKETINSLSRMDTLEVYAGICNHCKQDFGINSNNIVTHSDDIYSYQEPSFFISGSKTTLKNGEIHYGDATASEYMGNGKYKFYLDNMGFTPVPYFIIERNETGGINIYQQNGQKETDIKYFPKSNHVILNSPTLGIQTEIYLEKI